MAIYTTQVRSICEVMAEWTEDGTYNQSQIIETARPKIFDFTYPTFSAEQKVKLETNILKHYYFDEIGLETVNLWKLRLNIKLNEIMPKYVKMYELASREVDPLNDVNYTRDKREDNTHTKTNDNKTTTDGTKWSLYSDTPQGGISGLDSGTYLTNATKNTNDTTVDFDGKENKDEDKILHEEIKGKRNDKSYIELMSKNLDFTNKFYNIDLMIINELQDLFFGLWR